MESQRAITETPAVRLGQRLRRARLARNLTQSEVAQKQFSVSYISAVERGQIRPSLGALEKLADRLQIPLSDLLREDESPAPAAYSMDRADINAAHAEIDDRLREAQVLAYQNRGDEAVEVLTALTTRSLTPQEQVLVHWRLGALLVELGRADEARHEVQEALTLADQLGDVELRERLRSQLGDVYALAQRHQLALEQYQSSLDAIESGAIQDPSFHLMVLGNIGSQYRELGNIPAAIDALERAATLAGDVLNPERLGEALWALSQTYRQQGDARRASTYALRSLNAYEDAARRRLAARVYTRLGRALSQSNRVDEALVHLEQALAMAEEQQDALGTAEALRSLAAVYLQQGRVDDAAATAARAVEIAEATGDQVHIGESLVTQAHVQAARGDAEAAGNLFDQAITALQGADSPQNLADAYAQYSAFLESRGEGSRALDLLKQAWQLRERGGAAF